MGVDDTIWAISCDLATNSSSDYKIIKWDPFLGKWYIVPSRSGIKISVFNEVSAAVLTSDGLIFISSFKGEKSQQAVYYN